MINFDEFHEQTRSEGRKLASRAAAAKERRPACAPGAYIAKLIVGHARYMSPPGCTKHARRLS